VLLSVQALLWRTTLGIAATLGVCVLWYAPHRHQLREVSHTPYGNQISPVEAITAPFDQILLPGLMRFDGDTPVQSVAWVPLVVAIAIPVAMSPFLRNVRTACVLCASIVASILALTLSEAFVVPRYASFLLVPAFVLLATGSAEILGGLPRRISGVRTAISIAVIALLLVAFPANARNVTHLPREAHRDAALFIRAETEQSSLIYALMPEPQDVRFYLNRVVTSIALTGARSVCNRTVVVVYVEQRWRVPSLELPCLTRAGVRHETFEQYARGGRIDVWLIPPAP